jgi:hypothetical protein
MKRSFLLIIIVGVISIIVPLSLYFNENFHTTKNSAKQEFIASLDGTIISKFVYSNDHSRAFAIDSSGKLYVALNNVHELPLGTIYSNYTLYETSLNINELPYSDEYYYSEIHHEDKSFQLLLVSNDDVYTKVINRENVSRIGIPRAEEFLTKSMQNSPIQLHLLGFWGHDQMTDPKDQIFLPGEGASKEIKLTAINKDAK